MTTLATTPAARRRPGVRRARDVAAVSEAFVELMRTVRRSKARLVAAAGEDVGSATQLLLRTVASDGPMRLSALAAAAQADPSTVSRQVGTLVTRGLLERQVDPDDGRASRLVVTAAGHEVIAAHEHVRQSFFDQTLAGWTTEDLDQFAHLLTRFTASYDDVHARWLDTEAWRSTGPDHQEEGTTA